MQKESAKTPINLAWDDLRVILALIRGQTLAGAAKHLGLDSSTVFRNVRAIEKRLGVTLFDRSRKGFNPTALGERLGQTAERIEREMRDLEIDLSGKSAQPTGNLRVSTTDSVLHQYLIPALAVFAERYPHIQLELIAANELVNLNRRDADVVIRATPTPPTHLVGRSLGKLLYAVYAAPTYWQQKHSSNLGDHIWLTLDDSFGDHPTQRWRRAHYPAVQPRYRFNSMYALNQAIRSGAGIGLLPSLRGKDTTYLQALTPLIEDIPNELWILTHPDLRNVVRVRAFMEFCGEIIPPILLNTSTETA